MELAYFSYNGEPVLEQTSQNQADIVYMFLLCLEKDQIIINRNKEEFDQHDAEDIIYQCLAHDRCISESGRHQRRSTLTPAIYQRNTPWSRAQVWRGVRVGWKGAGHLAAGQWHNRRVDGEEEIVTILWRTTPPGRGRPAESLTGLLLGKRRSSPEA